MLTKLEIILCSFITYGKLSVIRQYACFIFIFMENCLQYDAIPDFSVSLRTGSNPAYINRFQSHTGKLQIENQNNANNNLSLYLQ